MSISVELSASTERQHEIELLGGRDENAKLPTGVLLGEHVAFETIDQLRGQSVVALWKSPMIS